MKMFYESRWASLLVGLGLALVLSQSFVVLAQRAERMRVIKSILGVGIGRDLDTVREKLDRLTIKKEQRSLERAEANERDEEREGGSKQAWTLTSTDYATIAVKADEDGRVVWVTGFVRPGRDIRFEELGDLSSATISSDSVAIWDVATPSGGYRVVAKGKDNRARVVSLLSLAGHQGR
jgi:hypothetical protein